MPGPVVTWAQGTLLDMPNCTQYPAACRNYESGQGSWVVLVAVLILVAVLVMAAALVAVIVRRGRRRRLQPPPPPPPLSRS